MHLFSGRISEDSKVTRFEEEEEEDDDDDDRGGGGGGGERGWVTGVREDGIEISERVG